MLVEPEPKYRANDVNAGVDRINSTSIFRVVIPKRQPVKLFIDSDLSLSDSSGVQLQTKRPTAQVIDPGNLDSLLFSAKVP